MVNTMPVETESAGKLPGGRILAGGDVTITLSTPLGKHFFTSETRSVSFEAITQSHPSFSAREKRALLMGVIADLPVIPTKAAPFNLATAAVNKPMGPHPKIITLPFSGICALFTAEMATARGSVRQA